MAIVEVKVPQLSESVAEATLLQWKKKVGDAIAIDEILIEIETDKVVLEVPAPSAGVLVELLVPDGSTVAAEQLIARIDTEATAGAVAPAAAAPAGLTAAVAVQAATGGAMAGVAMPAAAKLMADNSWSRRFKQNKAGFRSFY
jgi:2-oxoglutarate dehydrogenase E2 component (dihydrolipoamide succinyltransferase)